MNAHTPADAAAAPVDSGLRALCGIAAFFRIAADPMHLASELALTRAAGEREILRAAGRIGLKARAAHGVSEKRFRTLPTPAIVGLPDGSFHVFGGLTPTGKYRIVDPVTRRDREIAPQDLSKELSGLVIQVARRVGGPGIDPQSFSFRWFLPSIWRYRKPLIGVSPERPASLQIGRLNSVVQKTFKVVSQTLNTKPRVTPTALIQVNQTGGYAINSWVTSFG